MRAHQVERDPVTVPRARGTLASVAEPPDPQPSHAQREPLVPGPPDDGPEGEGHGGGHRHQGDQHPGHGRARPQPEHPHDQPGGNGCDLAPPPAGDDPAPFQRGEPEAHPLRSSAALSHFSDPIGPAG